MAGPDFAALLQARVDDDMRPIHTQPIFFDLKALAELRGIENRLEEITLEKRQAAMEQRTLGTTPGDVRMAGSDHEETELRKRHARLVEDVHGTMAYAVFKAPTAERQQEMAEESKAQKLDKLAQNTLLIMESFDHWEWEGKRVDTLDAAALEKLLPKMSQGEVYSIVNPLVALSGGAVDVPKSVSAFVKTSTRGGTPNSRSSKASR